MREAVQCLATRNHLFGEAYDQRLTWKKFFIIYGSVNAQSNIVYVKGDLKSEEASLSVNFHPLW